MIMRAIAPFGVSESFTASSSTSKIVMDYG
jgi:hypothetical protein